MQKSFFLSEISFSSKMHDDEWRSKTYTLTFCLNHISSSSPSNVTYNTIWITFHLFIIQFNVISNFISMIWNHCFCKWKGISHSICKSSLLLLLQVWIPNFNLFFMMFNQTCMRINLTQILSWIAIWKANKS